ncbi:methyltransferase domain-containing protein [Thiocystis violacea]|uniref:methyltransferase domain-containing protein n=1 Tax=Thiocystis violacea TaxID=13725 RepID=UPI0019052FEB|nr:methyltransferase domain-containing protein [Thiocystis violacea]MBK1720029.1 hypothetical protein [Thiocystis violacea]
MNKSLLLFVDPGYGGAKGRYQRYVARLREGTGQRGVEFRHLVAQHAHTSSDGSFLPWFSHSLEPADLAVHEDLKQQRIDAFAARLHRLLVKLAQGLERDHAIRLFMYRGHPELLPAIAELMNDVALAGMNIVFHFNLFHVSTAFALKFNCAGYDDRIACIGARLAQLDSGERVRLTACSQRIINVYSRYLARSISLLTLPYCSAAQGGEDRASTDSVIKLGYLGDTEAEQGYLFVCRLYHDLLATHEWPQVNFKVRHHPADLAPALVDAVRGLAGSDERIEHVLGDLSPEQHDAFVKDCDILLLPRLRKTDPLRASEDLISAQCNGKPVVVCENTWLADQVHACGGGVVFTGADYEGFRDAVFEALERLPDLRAKCLSGARAFCDLHDPGRLIDSLFAEPISPTQPTPPAPAWGDGNRLELLPLSLLNQNPAITRLVYAEKVARRKLLGWHYILDLVWIVSQLKDLPPGSLVLDAGAGEGLVQYILLRMGFRVISVDFIARNGPDDIDWLAVSAGENFDNDYVQHLKDHYSAVAQGPEAERVLESADALQVLLARETAQLLFYRSDLSAMKLLSDGLVDAVVSVSALEHNAPEVVAQAVAECLRALKPDSPMLITTSAAQGEDWYHQPSKGWCYSEASLKHLFQLADEVPSNYPRYAEFMAALSQPGNELQVQLSPFYFAFSDNGMPWGRWQPEYLPVGIRKIKVD